ncbi:MAG: ABC transporter substrate-binding protein [Clostridia bacterium]|nr:ABC transporter substrate-binding protein [Clostridia bacterium]
MKKLLSFLLVAVLLASVLLSCSPAKPETINIYTLNGTTGFGIAKLMNDNKETNDYTITVQSDASVVTSALINGDIDIAMLPTNAAATVYNRTEGGVKILAVNTLGCLYLLTKDGVTVSSFADLEGKTVYVPAQNPTFIFTDLCKKNGLIPGEDITIDSTSYAQAANLRDALANGSVDIAVLPEPMVTIAISQAKQNSLTITNALDLTAEWDKVNEPGSLVQGCVVVRTAFLEAYPQAVEDFLKAYENSIEYLSTNTADAAQMIVDNGIFTNATVAGKAIPKCNICYLDGKDMKSAMETYLSVLYSIQPTSIGGKVPDENFYYNAK